MFTILGADGKEYGPVTAAKVQEWIAGGRANLETKARRAGEQDGKPLAEFPEFGAPPVAGQSLPPPPIPESAPLASGSPAAAAAAPELRDPKTIADEMIARAQLLDVFDCLGRSWNLWTANLLPLVGATVLMVLVQFVAGLIPLVGMFSGLFLPGVFYGGLYYYYLGKIRGEHREVGDIFAGFTKAFGPLVLTNLLRIGLSLLLFMPFMLPFLVWAIGLAMKMDDSGNLPENFILPGIGVMAAAGVGFLIAIYFSLSWCFAFVLTIDKRLGPWTSLEVSRRVVSRQWFRVFFVVFLSGLLSMLGLVGLIIGVFFTMPLMYGALLYAYEDLCNPKPPPSA